MVSDTNACCRILWIAGLLAFGNIAHAADKPNLKGGLWRVVVQVTIPNASGPSTGPAQYDRCLDPGNLRNTLLLPQNSPCQILDSRMTKDAVTWKMTCSQGGVSTEAKGEIKFKDTRFYGEIFTVAQVPQNQTMNITTKLEGMYLRECITANSSGPQNAPATKALPQYRD